MKRFILTLFAVVALAFFTPAIGSAQSRNGSGHGGGGGGQAAAPRGGSAPSGGGQHSSPPPSGGTAVRRGDGGSGAVAPSAPGGRQVYGRAVPRTNFPYSRVYVPSRYYGVSPWYYYSPYFYGAFGLGYWGWDPYWWGYPGYWGGGGYWGYPYYGPYGGGYWGGGGGYYGRDYRDYRDYGSLKLKVQPKDAEVYVDGYYMGQVDDFNGVFQHLDLESGTHKIEIRANGYQPLVFEMRIAPGRTVKYEGDLRPLRSER